jgi:hypothetical protein
MYTTGMSGGWRNDSHMFDGFGPGAIGMDLSGGLYDAGGEGVGALIGLYFWSDCAGSTSSVDKDWRTYCAMKPSTVSSATHAGLLGSVRYPGLASAPERVCCSAAI